MDAQQRVARYDAALRHIGLGKRAQALSGERAYAMVGLGR